MGVAPSNPAAVALGSNLGDRTAHLQRALVAVSSLPMTRLVRVSKFHETEAVGPGEQGRYLNAACVLETGLSCRELLERLLGIEAFLGRDRANEERWGPRTIDLDVLLFGRAIIDEPGLRVPHPRMLERAFVLVPLAEVAGDWVVPGSERTVAEALASLRG